MGLLSSILPSSDSPKVVERTYSRNVPRIGLPATDKAKVVFSGRQNNFSNRYRKGDYSVLLGESSGITAFSESRHYARYAARVYPALQTASGIATLQLYCATISSLPVKLLSAKGEEKDMPTWLKCPGGKYYKEINFRVLVSQIVSSLLLDGVAYVGINRVKGEIAGLVPLEPWAVRPEMTKDGRQFRVTNSGVNQSGYDFLQSYSNVALGFNTTNPADERVFGVDDMLIWNGGVTIPGLARGVSPFDLAASAVNVAIEVQNYAEEHYASNAARPTVFIFREKLVSHDRRNLSDTIADQFTGQHRHNVRAMFVNDPVNDVKIEQVGDLPRDADVAEVRQYNSTEIAQALRVPLPLAGIADPGSSSYNSIHVLKAHFASSVIAPIVKTLEDGFMWALESEGDRLVFDMKEITRGDPMTNTQIAERLKNAGISTTDESRTQVGLEPLGYEDLLVSKNSVKLDDVLEGKTVDSSTEGGEEGDIPEATGGQPGHNDGVAETNDPPED